MRAKFQSPAVTDEMLIREMNTAVTAESERISKFVAQKSSVRTAQTAPIAVSDAPQETRPSKSKEQIASKPILLIASLEEVKADIAILRQSINVNSENKNVPRRSNRSQSACEDCSNKHKHAECEHCFICGSAEHYARGCKKMETTGKPGAAACTGQSVAANETSHPQKHCKFCAAKNNVYFQCSKCSVSHNCSKNCQQKHWPEHKAICKALHITNNVRWENHHNDISSCHLTPKEQMKISNIVGKKCTRNCLLNVKEVMALWDTGSQIWIVSSDFVKQQYPSLQPRKLEEILGTSIELRTANNSPIPYCGFVELAFELAASHDGDKTLCLNVLFLVSDCHIANQIIGYNVNEEVIKSAQPDKDNLVRAFQVTFEQTRETTEALIMEIEAVKEPNLTTIRSPNCQITLQPTEVTTVVCRGNAEILSNSTKVIFILDERKPWPPG